MRIFVGYGYNERDRWIEEYVLPMLVAFGCEVVHGKAAYGGALPDEVTKLIRTSDALIGFTTRRESVAPGKYRTHDWVVHELLTAHSQEPRIPWVEIREEGVISPGGLPESAGTQRIEYRQQDRAGCLVKIAQALKRSRDLTRVTMIRFGADGRGGTDQPIAGRSSVCLHMSGAARSYANTFTTDSCVSY